MSRTDGLAEHCTNFRTIRSRVQRLEELEGMQEAGTLESQSKKQASRLKRELRKIKGNMEGIRKMGRLPGVVIVVDGKKEYLALREARKLGITTVGIIDTDCDPDTVDVVIPANDDSIRAISLLLDELADRGSPGQNNGYDSQGRRVQTQAHQVKKNGNGTCGQDGSRAATEETGETPPTNGGQAQ